MLKPVLKKVLIANRGEIACRIIRTAKRMGIATVAVYSDADAKALHVAHADQAVHIGPSPAPESYLDIARVIAAAKSTGADSVHPGYGFLSENPDFAEAVVKAGLIFIGPSAAAMRALGGKAAAKDIAIKAGVPVVPGYQGGKQDAKSLTKEAAKIGYPVMIKAVAGGGGRGMRLVEREADLAELLESAKREAQSAFANPDVLIEKVVVRPRHIEVQVFGDGHGNVVHLFERDCSLQRRNQKVIEEAPAPGMSPALRAKICGAAVTLAKSVGYEGAGTVEFLVEGGALGADAPWYFIEMNTRLQVEHPVTEEITGLDLVEWQFRVAAGEKLPRPQDKITMSGHAIEVRLCAEDPANGFMPSIGTIERAWFPVLDGLRVETGVRHGSAVSPFYDSMVAKLIAVAPERHAAIALLRGGLAEVGIMGLETNAAFLDKLLANDDFAHERLDTALIGCNLAALTTRSIDPLAVAEAAHWLVGGPLLKFTDLSAWSARDGFQLGGKRVLTLPLSVNGRVENVQVLNQPGEQEIAIVYQGARASDDDRSSERLTVDWGRTVRIVRGLSHIEITYPTYDPSALDEGDTSGAIRAPINGRVARVFVAVGDALEKGARVAVVEAMKMEHVVVAGSAGRVVRVDAVEGAQVTQGTILVTLETEPAT